MINRSNSKRNWCPPIKLMSFSFKRRKSVEMETIKQLQQWIRTTTRHQQIMRQMAIFSNRRAPSTGVIPLRTRYKVI